MAPHTKSQLRLFTTFDGVDKRGEEHAEAAGPRRPAPPSCPLLTAPATPLDVSFLLWRTLSPVPDPAHGLDTLAPLFRDHLLPGWAAASRVVPCYATQYKAWAEAPLAWGVPGLCAWADARSRWADAQIRAALADGIRQVVLLGSGWSTAPYRMHAPGVVFYEVDDAVVLRRKRALLDAVLPDARLHPRPRFVALDVSTNPKQLIPAVTAAGLDPGARCLVVMEGLLPHLPQERVDALLSDLSALASPGSRLCWDFLHAHALDSLAGAGPGPGREPALAGLEALAATAADKGRPLRSGMAPTASGLVRYLQPFNLRLGDLLLPPDIQRQLVAPPAPPSGPTAEPHRARCCGLGAARPPRPPPVPGFVALASAVKASPSLPLRGLAAAHGGGDRAAEASGAARRSSSTPGAELLAAWVPGAGVAGPGGSCLLRSVYYLLWGSASSAAADGGGRGSTAAAHAALPPTLPPGPAPGRRPPSPEGSAEWRLGTVVQAAAGGGRSGEGAPASSAPGAAGACSASGGGGAPAASGRPLDRAQSLVLPPPRGAGAASGAAGGSGAGAESGSELEAGSAAAAAGGADEAPAWAWWLTS